MVFLGWASQADGYTCPVVIKEASAVLAKAETAVTKVKAADRAVADRALARAKKLLGDAKKDHEGATAKVGHSEAVRKAKTAKAFAEQVLTLAEP